MKAECPAESKGIIDEFLEYKRHFKDLTPATIHNYNYHLTRFFSCYRKAVDAITEDDIMNWLEKFEQKKVTSYNLEIGVLSSFFKFCVLRDYIEDIPFVSLWVRKRPEQPAPNYIGKKDVAKIMVEITKLSLRNKAIVWTLLTSGLRREELTTIEVQNINFRRNVVRVKAKGGHFREANFSPEASVLLKELIETLPDKKGRLFRHCYNGNPLRGPGIYQIIVKLGKSCEIENGLTPHQFRHEFATKLANAGVDINVIRKLLGHLSIDSTKRYTITLPEELKRRYHSVLMKGW